MRELSPVEKAAEQMLLEVGQSPRVDEVLLAQLGLWGLDNMTKEEMREFPAYRAMELLEELGALDPAQAKAWLEQNMEEPPEDPGNWLQGLSPQEAAEEIIDMVLRLDGALDPKL